MRRSPSGLIWSVALATALCLLLATRVFVQVERARVKLLRQPVAAAGGTASARASSGQLDALVPPFALIARIQNPASSAAPFTIAVDGYTVCTATVKASATRRIDCAVFAPWRPGAEHDVSVSGEHTPWALEYLELATHHGSSAPPLAAFVLPRGAGNFRVAPAWALASTWVLLVAGLLLPRRPFVSRVARWSYAAAAAIATGLCLLVLVSPHVSPYLVVISTGTFAWLAFVPLAPRVLPFTWRHAQPWLGTGARLTPLAARALVQLSTRAQRGATRAWPLLAGRQWWIAMALSLALCTVAVLFGARAVGGADEYGYVSQADLWLEGSLKIQQPVATLAPWPQAPDSFAPLGYRPDPLDRGAIVPTYAPGLPLLLALAKAIGGQDAVFLVVPLSAGLLVFATYAVGRRLRAEVPGLIAAWLVATSPVVLFMMMSVMTDVPVAAAWAWAFYLLLGTSAGSAIGAGLLSGLAVLIRPNLAPLAGLLALRYVLAMRGAERRRSIVQLVGFGAAAVPWAVAVALVNNHLYGSPLASGYGRLGDLYSWSRVATNLRLYAGWFVEAQTPIALAGLLAILVPLRRWWPGVPDRRIFVVIGLFVVGLWANYCAWEVFDAWWFSRFLIASWPFIMLGLGAVATAACRGRGRSVTALAIACVIALGVVQVRFARRNIAFEHGANHRRFVGVARLVRHMTPANSVILSLDHSGSIRYYGGRMTMNYDSLLPSRLDQAVEWLAARGVRTYAALEDWEVPHVKQRFAGSHALAALDAPALASYQTPGQMFLFDLAGPRADSGTTVIEKDVQLGWRAPGPVGKPKLMVKP